MSFAPSLRAEIERQPREDGGVHLYDPLTDRGLELGALSAGLIDRLDGTTPLDTLLDGTSEDDRRRLLRTVKMLQLLLFLRGSGEHVIARLASIRAGEPLHHTVLDGARFECQGSGQCCQNYVFGPLTDADIARLEGLDLSAFGPGPYWGFLERKDGKPERYLTSTNDRCMFLEGDHRCGIHARFGADAKPGLCRMYPLEQIATVDGIRLYDKGTCATLRPARWGTRSSTAPSSPVLPPAQLAPDVQSAAGLPLDTATGSGSATSSAHEIGALSPPRPRADRGGAVRCRLRIDVTLSTGTASRVVGVIREERVPPGAHPPAIPARPWPRGLFAELQQVLAASSTRACTQASPGDRAPAPR